MLIPILTAAIIIVLGYFGFLVFRHLSDLKNIDPDSILEEKQNKARTKILKDRLERRGSEVRGRLSTMVAPHKNFFARQFSVMKNKVAALEEKYHDDLKRRKAKTANIDDLFSSAEELVKQGDFSQAEKKLIEVIAKDQKNNKAYEMLADIYMITKDYAQAEEILKYLIRLLTVKSGTDNKLDLISLSNEELLEAEMDFLKSFGGDNRIATYYIALGELYELTDRDKDAVDCVLRAASVEPNNPKFLDKLIEIGIRIGDKGLAKKIFNHMKKINPENGKLVIWKESIEKMS